MAKPTVGPTLAGTQGYWESMVFILHISVQQEGKGAQERPLLSRIGSPAVSTAPLPRQGGTMFELYFASLLRYPRFHRKEPAA